MGKAPKSVKLPNGTVARRDIAAEHSGSRPAGGGWPIVCCASGVNASQAGELRAFFKKHGFSCDVTNGGDPVYRNENHKRKAMKLRGIHDRNSFV